MYISGCLPRFLEEWKKLFLKKKMQEDKNISNANDDNNEQLKYTVPCLNCGASNRGFIPQISQTNPVKSSNQTEQHKSHDKEKASLESGWSPSVTWERLGLLVAAEFGPKRALELISDIQVPQRALSLQFYQSCAAFKLLEKQQK